MKVFQEQANLKDIQLQVDFPKEMNVESDPDHVALVFRNIVNNCIKFTPKGGQIVITASIKPTQVEVQIKDNGVGMDEKTLAAVKTGKMLVSKPGTQGEPGSGLGLALCMDTLEKIGGHLQIESTKDLGSQFKIQLSRS